MSEMPPEEFKVVDEDALGFSTRAIRAGQEPDPSTGDVIPAIHLSSTYIQDGIGKLREGYEYARGGNPTRTSLQEQLANLEGAEFGYSFASGLAAEDALVRATLSPGDTIVIGNDAYGGTYRLFTKIHSRWGINVETVDMSDTAAVAKAIEKTNPAMVWIETPSNPLLKLTDIAAVTSLAKKAGAISVVDNTLATPYLQQPLALGADVVVHSTTKYLGGHSDVIGGAVLTNDVTIAEGVQFLQYAAGGISGPLDAWLTTRGLKTLSVRMDKHGESALELAHWLAEQDGVEQVYYPGLADHPEHELAAKQMRNFGGMVSVSFTGGAAVAQKVAESTRVFTLAESLGGIESLVNYPCEMTHASVAGTELAVADNLLRLSIGLEDVADLIADLTQALK